MSIKIDSVCSEVMCLKFCEYGNELDTNGCPICRCKSPVVDKEDCKFCIQGIYCKNGFVFDENGCNTCKCIV